MKRTQLQIPEPLYAEVKRVAKARDWSVSEVFRRAVEQYVSECPAEEHGKAWVLPEPRHMGIEKIPSDRWKEVVADDEGHI